MPSAFNWGVTYCVAMAQIISTFTVASKASLLTVERTNVEWTVSVHKIPAYFLIASHGAMLLCTLFIIVWLSKHPSGLMWDPAALADQVALFAQCGTLSIAATFELPSTSPKEEGFWTQKPKDFKGSYRLGYWARMLSDGTSYEEIIYGIADTLSRKSFHLEWFSS